ncbi:MAG: hypothetical protein U0531_11200 [Dehalococcoidia bacterium]
MPTLQPFATAGGNQIGINPATADMVRLNYNVAPSTTPARSVCSVAAAGFQRSAGR